MKSLARSLVRDEHLAEDVVQDTFVSALESSPKEPHRIRRWLAAILRNQVRGLHRSGERESELTILFSVRNDGERRAIRRCGVQVENDDSAVPA